MLDWTKDECNELLSSLIEGKRYTFMMSSEFGFPAKIQVTYNSGELKPYAQYAHSVVLYFKRNRARKLFGIRLYGIKDIIIYEGWIDLDKEVETEVVIKDDDKCTLIKSKYTCFDSRYFTDVLTKFESMKINPVFYKLK